MKLQPGPWKSDDVALVTSPTSLKRFAPPRDVANAHAIQVGTHALSPIALYRFDFKSVGAITRAIDFKSPGT